MGTLITKNEDLARFYNDLRKAIVKKLKNTDYRKLFELRIACGLLEHRNINSTDQKAVIHQLVSELIDMGVIPPFAIKQYPKLTKFRDIVLEWLRCP